MRLALLGVLICTILVGCVTDSPPIAPESINQRYIKLGDSEDVMVTKMREQGARDVTKHTPKQFYHSVSADQRYYWWVLPDDTVVAVLVTGPSTDKLTVTVIETSEPGIGLDGIRNWRSRNLKSESSLARPPTTTKAERRSR